MSMPQTPTAIRRGKAPLVLRLHALPRAPPPPTSCLPAVPPATPPPKRQSREDVFLTTSSPCSAPESLPAVAKKEATDFEQGDLNVTVEEDQLPSTPSKKEQLERPTLRNARLGNGTEHVEVKRARVLLARLAESPILIQWATCSLDTLTCVEEVQAFNLAKKLLAVFQDLDIDVEEAHWTIEAVTSFYDQTTKKAAELDQEERRDLCCSDDDFLDRAERGDAFSGQRIRRIVKRRLCAEDEFQVWAAWRRIIHCSSTLEDDIGALSKYEQQADGDAGNDEKQHDLCRFFQHYRRRQIRNSTPSANEDVKPLVTHLAEAREWIQTSVTQDWSYLNLPAVRHRISLMQKATKEEMATLESRLDNANTIVDQLCRRIAVLERAVTLPRSPTSSSSSIESNSSSASSSKEKAKLEFLDNVLFAMATPPRSTCVARSRASTSSTVFGRL
ncbi:hypothetical protein FA10DRAFT_284443 [Acaromyces ingoldii]|uniref:Uncharacterized protein n=1 Tax=Acaromyces ingoldii TaxID=215250 RepID=A0A316YQJ6_9BASI|nr:hypothetical protein FA10DRAFT_284443 [Acaromyces ingoldii]PWN91511.1 hypothetical protein FA10DRAFT_284443 [Acaromyces ingoldii]